MSKSKNKNVKVRDLKPSKDAKGGGGRTTSPTGGGLSITGGGKDTSGGGISTSGTGGKGNT